MTCLVLRRNDGTGHQIAKARGCTLEAASSAIQTRFAF
jgi:hypothetical protein